MTKMIDGLGNHSSLPKKLSELMRIALKDEDKAFRSKRYEIDMNLWHEVHEDICKVCLAGAVIAGTLGGDRHRDLSPSDFKSSIGDQLEALDVVRDGHISAALLVSRTTRSHLRADRIEEEIIEKVGYPPTYLGERSRYSRNRKRWRKWMFRCVRELEKRGL